MMRGLAPTALLLAIPAMTGLASVLWAKMVKSSPELSAAANILACVCVFAILTILRGAGLLKGVATLPDPRLLWGVAAYAALSVLISLSWMAALERSSLPIISVMEISYPLFILLFTAALVEPVSLTRLQIGGGLFILVGTGLVLCGHGSSSGATA